MVSFVNFKHILIWWKESRQQEVTKFCKKISMEFIDKICFCQNSEYNLNYNLSTTLTTI